MIKSDNKKINNIINNTNLKNKKVDIDDNTTLKNKKVDINDNITLNNKKVDIDNNITLKNKKVDIDDNTTLKNKKVDIDDNTTLKNKKVDIDDNTTLNNKKVDIDNNITLKNKKVDIDDNTTLKNKKVDIDDNTTLKNKKVDIDDNTTLKNKKVDINDNITLNNKKVDIDNNITLKNKKVDIDDNTTLKNKKVDIDDNTTLNNKKVDIDDNTTLKNKKVDIDDNITLKNKKVDIDNNITLKNKKVDIDDNTTLKNKKVDIDNKITLKNNKVDIDDNITLKDNKVDIIKDDNNNIIKYNKNLNKVDKEVLKKYEYEYESKYESEIEYKNNYSLSKEYKNIYIKTIPKILEFNIYKGKIINKFEKEIVVDIGFKSEGIIYYNELGKKLFNNLKVGDTIEVMLKKKDYKGQCLLSYKQAKIIRNWEKINKYYELGEIVMGLVIARTKGGLIVVVCDIECFLPGSHIDVKPVKNYDIYINKTLEVKIVKINQKTKNVVVSHKILIEKDIEEQKIELISKLEKGQVVEGKVKNITNYGAFIDLGGVDALLHITDISWKRIEHPSEILKLDQTLNLVVLVIDKKKNRVQLGLKQLLPHPWTTLDNNIKVGNKVKGIVTVLSDYGAFVEISPGVEGLIHVSELSWYSDLQSAQDFVKIGQEVEVIILSIDVKERKISLSIKQLTNDPWINIEKKYIIGSKHIVKIKKITNFGVFVELSYNIRGLIKNEDLSWNNKNVIFNKNDKIEVIVIGIDNKYHRIKLGCKQLMKEKKSFEIYKKLFNIGEVYTGTITKKNDNDYSEILLENKEKNIILVYSKLNNNIKNLKIGKKENFKIKEYQNIDNKIIVHHYYKNKNIKKIFKYKSKLESKLGYVSKSKDKFKSKSKSKSNLNLGYRYNLGSTLGGELNELLKLKDKMENKIKKNKNNKKNNKKNK